MINNTKINYRSLHKKKNYYRFFLSLSNRLKPYHLCNIDEENSHTSVDLVRKYWMKYRHNDFHRNVHCTGSEKGCTGNPVIQMARYPTKYAQEARSIPGSWKRKHAVVY